MSTIDLKAAQAPTREARLGSITTYAGPASELVQCAHAGKLADKDRSFTQCLGCGTSNAACTVILIQDAAVISHGPVGCSGCFHEFAFTYRVNGKHRGVTQPTQRRIFSTNLEERDTVFGGNQKLEAAIREVFERAVPKAIFIVTTCASGIIGDDVEGIANEAERELGIPVAAIFCEGFRSRIWTSGFDSGYHAIARKLIRPPRQKRDDVVNVINFWGADIFSELFGRIGLKPRYLTPYATVQEIAESSEAIATIQICATLGSYLGAALEQEYGVPEIKTAAPYGVAQTERWWRELGRMTHREGAVERLIAEEREKWLPRISALRAQLEGKRACVTAGASHGHALIAVLRELGLEVYGAALYHHDPLYDHGAEEADALQHVVRDYGDIPKIAVCNKQEHELANVLNRLRPDVLLARHGGMTLWGAKLGIPSLLVGDEHFGMGLQGIVRYGERILEVIENDEFVKNLARHAIIPYTRWWLEQRPDHFHEKSAHEGGPHVGNP